MTVTGASTFLVHNATASFGFQDFALTANPPSIIVNTGTEAISTIQLTSLNGFPGVISLTTNSTLCTLSPINVTSSGASTLTCESSTTSYAVTVTGSSGPLTHAVPVTVTVQSPSVGGVVIPVDRLELLVQFLPVFALIPVVLALGIIAVRSRRSQKKS